ncbi:hypothetical protein [Radicibacter daui]|uniref:hypothetical protein n=1 Tax=Radicibacter daui TaxID=3064829 RepID=UPI004046C1FD
MIFFPSFIEYTSYGSILDKIAYDEKSSNSINLETVAGIKAFATDAMISTFLFGISASGFSTAIDECKKEIENVARSTGFENHPDFLSSLSSSVGEFGKNIMEEARKTHYWPLWNVITSLPLDDMAELAETLVRLESLKEKVTQPTQSVGGPVDVAIITKHDGFIWKKRKLYFEGNLNPRYFAKINALGK